MGTAGRWPVYAAIGWTVLFAGMSFYWVLGGLLYVIAGRNGRKCE